MKFEWILQTKSHKLFTHLGWTRHFTNLINTKVNKARLHLSFRGQRMELSSINTD